MRVLYSTDSYCPCCGHNRDTSSVSTINLEDGRYQCQMCQTVWLEANSTEQDEQSRLIGGQQAPASVSVEPSITVGKWRITQTAKDRYWVGPKEGGEGGMFTAMQLEPYIKEFYHEHF